MRAGRLRRARPPPSPRRSSRRRRRRRAVGRTTVAVAGVCVLAAEPQAASSRAGQGQAGEGVSPTPDRRAGSGARAPRGAGSREGPSRPLPRAPSCERGMLAAEEAGAASLSPSLFLPFPPFFLPFFLPLPLWVSCGFGFSLVPPGRRLPGSRGDAQVERPGDRLRDHALFQVRVGDRQQRVHARLRAQLRADRELPADVS